MVEVLESTDCYVAEFKRLASVRASRPAWLRRLNESAFHRFENLGFPTSEHEDWRFTQVAPIAQSAFRIPQGSPGPVPRADMEAYSMAGVGNIEVVFVDGRFSPDLSTPAISMAGIVVTSIEDSLESHGAILECHLGQYANMPDDAFTALNAAFMDCGAAVVIPKGAVFEGLIHLLYVSTRASAGTMTHPRNLIIAGDHCQAAVLESYVSSANESYFTNAVTEIVAGENSVIEHYMIVRDSVQAFNISMLRVQQARNSNFTSHSVLLGGGLVRNNVHPVLNGEGCQSLLNGLFLVNGRQHMDNFMRVEHARPHGDSRQFYKGILDDEGSAVFSGRIIVHKDAQKTDAKQTNMNLLLSDTAQIDTKPQLEIYADDVKCTHGATIGQIDAEAVFYLRSRGLSLAAARSLLIYAFAGESLGRMKETAIRQKLEGLLATRLPHAGPAEARP